MPQPDVSDVHVNSLLTNMSVGYMQDEAGFVADKVFPVIMSDKQSDLYATYNRDAWFRDFGERMRRAPGGIAARSGWTIDPNGTFKCENEAIGTEIPDELRSNADMVYNLDADATRFVTNAQLIRRERLFATNQMKTGHWGTDKAGANSGGDFLAWDNYSTSTPFQDLDTFRNIMRQKIGRFPNKAVLSYDLWLVLKNHPQFIDRIKGGATVGNPALFNQQQFAQFVEIPEVLTSMATYNSTAEQDPTGTAVLANIMPAYTMLLLYVPTSASLLTPAAGYTFVWQPLVNGGAIQYIRKYRDEPARKDVVEAYSYFTHQQTAPDAGLFIHNAAGN